MTTITHRRATKPVAPGTTRKATVTDSTRELGLDLTAIVARHLFQTDHLHYGYWPEDLAVSPANLRQAQENYSNFLVGHIPPGVRTILDVGAGTGALARRLTKAGYVVDCVSPSASLSERIHTMVGEDTCIFACRYEDIQTEQRYDLVLFSESFQYIRLIDALAITCGLLNPGGHLLICDFFRNETPEGGPFGGGHRLLTFWQEVNHLPLRVVTEEDITDRITPNLDLTTDFMEAVVVPARDRLLRHLEVRYRVPYRLLRWTLKRALRRRLALAQEKYFTGKRCGANFKIYKTYQLLLLQKTDFDVSNLSVAETEIGKAGLGSWDDPLGFAAE